MAIEDAEMRFISALLSAKPEEQQRFYTQQIPLGVFTVRQQEMLWINRYREKHGQYPSSLMFRTQYGESLPKHDDPLSATLQPILDMFMFEEMRKVQVKVKRMIDEGKPIADAMAIFKQGAYQLHDFSVDYVDSAFARSMSSLSRYREVVRMKSDPKARLVDFPWPTMNKLIHFMRPGNTGVLASRTSIGKTWVVVRLAHYWATKDIPVLFITKEMPTEEIEDRFEALHFGLPYEDFRGGTLSGKLLRRWRNARAQGINLPITICGDETLEGTGLEHVTAKIQQYKPSLVVIDGAYLLRAKDTPKNASRVEVLGYLSRRIKVIAKATKTIIWAVIQLNRTAEDKAGNTRGGIVSIYGSDTWAQDSDYVAALGGKRGANNRTIDLVKGRESNVGSFNIGFNLAPYPDFSELKNMGSKPTNGKVHFNGI